MSGLPFTSWMTQPRFLSSFIAGTTCSSYHAKRALRVSSVASSALPRAMSRSFASSLVSVRTTACKSFLPHSRTISSAARDWSLRRHVPSRMRCCEPSNVSLSSLVRRYIGMNDGTSPPEETISPVCFASEVLLCIKARRRLPISGRTTPRVSLFFKNSSKRAHWVPLPEPDMPKNATVSGCCNIRQRL